MSENQTDVATDPTPVEALEGNGDDLATLLARREHAKPNPLTWALLAFLVLSVGLIGGAFAHKQFGSSGTSSVPDFASLMAGGGPPSGANFPGSGTGNGTGGEATIGTVTLVDGTNLYVTDSNGNTIMIVVPATASVTSQEEVALYELTAGTSVLVRGATADDGTVTATSVAQTAPRSTPTGTTPAPRTAPTNQGDN